MIWFGIAVAGWAAVLALFIERGKLLNRLRESDDRAEAAIKGWERTTADFNEAVKGWKKTEENFQEALEVGRKAIDLAEAERDREKMQ